MISQPRLVDAPAAPAPARARDLRVSMAAAADTQLVKAFVRQHHSLLPHAPAGWLVASIARDPAGNVWAVAIWGRPVARHADRPGVVELTRLVVRDGAPRNTATYVLARARRDLLRAYPATRLLMSYCDCDAHTGAMYRADNWHLAAPCAPGSGYWHNRVGRADVGRRMRARWERQPS